MIMSTPPPPIPAPLCLPAPRCRSGPLQRMNPVDLKLSRHVVNIHDGGVYHRDLGVHCVVVSNFALKTTFGAGDVHLVGYERAGTVSNRFRNEVGFYCKRGGLDRPFCRLLPVCV